MIEYQVNGLVADVSGQTGQAKYFWWQDGVEWVRIEYPDGGIRLAPAKCFRLKEA